MEVCPHFKYLSSVEGDGTLARELEQHHHDKDDKERMQNLGKILKITTTKDARPVAEVARGTRTPPSQSLHLHLRALNRGDSVPSPCSHDVLTQPVNNLHSVSYSFSGAGPIPSIPESHPRHHTRPPCNSKMSEA